MTIAALAGLAAVVLGPLALFDVADPSVDALGIALMAIGLVVLLASGLPLVGPRRHES